MGSYSLDMPSPSFPFMLLHTGLATGLLVFAMVTPSAAAKIYPDDFVNPSRNPADWSHEADPADFVEGVDWEGVAPTFTPAPDAATESLYWPSALPGGNVTRGEFVTAIVSRLYTQNVLRDCYFKLGPSLQLNYTLLFWDVSTDSPYGPAICVAMRNGLARGMSSGYFAPDRAITKAEASTIFARLSQTMFMKLRPVRRNEAWYAPSWEVFMQSIPSSSKTMRPGDALSGAELRSWICAFSDSDISLDPFMECSK